MPIKSFSSEDPGLNLIGCKDENLLHHYENDQDMYETCDITIEMIDSWYWKVFSKDEALASFTHTRESFGHGVSEKIIK